MKQNAVLIFIITALLLLTACSAPAEQIVTITVQSTPLPAVTPAELPKAEETAVPADETAPEEAAVSTAAPTSKPTAKPTPKPTAVPAAEPAESPAADPTAEPAESAADSDFGSGMLSLVNSYRSSAGLNSIKYSSAMQKAADTRAKECAVSFSHTRPDGSKAYTALTERGIAFTAFGENIFAASGMDSVSAEYVMESWMNSSAHRDNILRDGFTHMCVGTAVSGDEIFVVQLFGAGIS